MQLRDSDFCSFMCFFVSNGNLYRFNLPGIYKKKKKKKQLEKISVTGKPIVFVRFPVENDVISFNLRGKYCGKC